MAGVPRTPADRVVVGDVFQGGLYLAEDDILVVTGPDAYQVASAAPSPASRANGTLQWTGPLDFADERPRVVFAPAQATTTTTSAGERAGAGGATRWVYVAIGVLVVLTAAGIMYRRYAGRPDEPDASTAGSTGVGAGPVTDEERVREVLRRRDGRVKQADLADALDWSASKTSRVVSRMADEGAVDKLRIGRENLVALPENED